MKTGLLVLLLVIVFGSMPVIAADLEFANSHVMGIFGTTINQKEEVIPIRLYEVIPNQYETACPLAVPPSGIEANPAQTGCLINYYGKQVSRPLIEGDDSKEYIYRMRKRKADHPSFLGIA